MRLVREPEELQGVTLDHVASSNGRCPQSPTSCSPQAVVGDPTVRCRLPATPPVSAPVRVGLVAPPWSPVPPIAYGAIEAQVHYLATGPQAAGHDVVLVASGDSTCPVPRRATFPTARGPDQWISVELVNTLEAYDRFGRSRHRARPHGDGPDVLGALSRAAGRHHHPRRVQRGDDRHLPAQHRAACRSSPSPTRSASPRRRSPSPASSTTGSTRPTSPSAPATAAIASFLGRMSPDKGAHRAIEVAKKAGVPLRMAAKMREPWEFEYFDTYVEAPPLRGHPVPRRGAPRAEARPAGRRPGPPVPHPVERALRHGDDRGLRVRHAGARVPEGAAPEVVEDGRTGFLCHDVEEAPTAYIAMSAAVLRPWSPARPSGRRG